MRLLDFKAPTASTEAYSLALYSQHVCLIMKKIKFSHFRLLCQFPLWDAYW